MANTKPVQFTDTLHMRCDAAFLADLDDMRAEERPLASRADLIRKLVREEKARRLKRKPRG